MGSKWISVDLSMREPKSIPIRRQSKNRCSRCKETGHNKQSCTAEITIEAAIRDVSSDSDDSS